MGYKEINLGDFMKFISRSVKCFFIALFPICIWILCSRAIFGGSGTFSSIILSWLNDYPSSSLDEFISILNNFSKIQFSTDLSLLQNLNVFLSFVGNFFSTIFSLIYLICSNVFWVLKLPLYVAN